MKKIMTRIALLIKNHMSIYKHVNPLLEKLTPPVKREEKKKGFILHVYRILSHWVNNDWEARETIFHYESLLSASSSSLDSSMIVSKRGEFEGFFG